MPLRRTRTAAKKLACFDYTDTQVSQRQAARGLRCTPKSLDDWRTNGKSYFMREHETPQHWHLIALGRSQGNIQYWFGIAAVQQN